MPTPFSGVCFLERGLEREREERANVRHSAPAKACLLLLIPKFNVESVLFKVSLPLHYSIITLVILLIGLSIFSGHD